MSRMIAVDWGTTSLRAALLDADGAVLEESSSPQGILHVAPGGFGAVLAAQCARWAPPDTSMLCLMSGMIGSRQGWQEASYCPCPAGFADVAAQLAWLAGAPPGLRVAIVPGLSVEDADVPDVLRGEETQVFGALHLSGSDEGLFVLPGTHSKWVQVEAGRVARFATCMTGEVYGLLRRHSILARTMPADDDGALDEASFLRGVAHAQASGSLLRAAFSARTLALFDRLPAAAQPSYLSGLLIGEELRAQAGGARGHRVTLIGAPALTARYALALSALGITSRAVGSEATWAGLHAIARSLESRTA